MNLLSFLMILIGVLLNAAAQLFLKAGTNAIGALNFSRGELLKTFLQVALQPNIIAGLGCYILSVSIWIVALSRVPVSIAYPMLSIGYIVNAAAAYYLFGELISFQKIIGITIIIIGVILVGRS